MASRDPFAMRDGEKFIDSWMRRTTYDPHGPIDPAEPSDYEIYFDDVHRLYKTRLKPIKEKSTMNLSIAICLINSNVKLVKCSYEPAVSKDAQPATTLFKTFNKDLNPGDYVVVPTNTRHLLTICRVEEVNVALDPNTTADVQWIVDVAHLDAFHKMKGLEAQAITAIKAAEVNRQREELRKNMMLDAPEVTALDAAKADGTGLLIDQKPAA